MKRVLYTGSFDPITKGHMNIISQALNIFDEVIVAILANPTKKDYFFTLEERFAIVKYLYQNCDKVKVITGNETSVDLAIMYNCQAILKGLRNTKDFVYEKEMSEINLEISDNKINTVCLFADLSLQNVSSTNTKILFDINKDITKYVDDYVYNEMVKKRELKNGN